MAQDIIVEADWSVPAYVLVDVVIPALQVIEVAAERVQIVELTTGIVGPKGDPGPTGPMGPTGPQGIQGEIGPIGPVGPTGPQGIQGEIGPIGPQGIQGIQGEQGDIGPQGEKGDKGDKGDTGPMGSASWGSITGILSQQTDLQAALDAKVSKAGDFMTGPFKLADGTVAAPGLAFNSEAGLGWYREGGGIVSMAQGGIKRFAFHAATPAASYIVALPGAAGGASNLQLWSDPEPHSNSDYFTLSKSATGTVFISAATGTGTRKQFTFDAPFHNFVGGVVQCGSGFKIDEDTYFSAGGSGYVINFAPRWFLNWNTTNGDFSWSRDGQPTTVFLANGDFLAGRDVYAGVGANIAMIGSGGLPYLRFTGDGWKLIYSAGYIYWQHPNGTNLSWTDSGGNFGCQANITATANIYAAGNSIQFTTGGTALQRSQLVFGESAPIGSLQQTTISASPAGMSQQVAFRHNPSVSADIYMGVGSGAYTFDNNGQAYKSGAGTAWGNISDERLKDVIGPYQYGLDQILALEPVWFKYKDQPDMLPGVNVIAQAAQQVMPEMISIQKGHPKAAEIPDILGVQVDFAWFAMINAIKTLHARVAALEAV